MSTQRYDLLEFELPKGGGKIAFEACTACACLVADKARHDEWHNKVGAATMGFGGLVGL